MNKVFILSLLIITCSFSYSQNEILNNSVKLRILKIVNGYTLENAVVDKCTSKEIINFDSEINQIKKYDDYFTVEYFIRTNCCSNFIFDAEIIDGSTLNLLYYEHGKNCSCVCEFKVTAKFKENTDYIGDRGNTTIINNQLESKYQF